MAVNNQAEKIVAHNYSDLFKYEGQIYEFLVHDVLKYEGHKKLASTAVKVFRDELLSNSETVILDMGAGHGSDLQELRNRGFKGPVFALDVCEEAKEAHYSEQLFVKQKYNDYFLGNVSENATLKAKIDSNVPDIFIVGTVTPPNSAVSDVASVLSCMKPKKSYLIINLPVKDDSSDRMYKFLEYLENNNYLRKRNQEVYFHRNHLNGQPFDMTMFTYALMKKLPEGILDKLKS